MMDVGQARKILGVERSASDVALRKAWRKMALQNHPDRGGIDAVFISISDAYQTLIDYRANPWLYEEPEPVAKEEFQLPGPVSEKGYESSKEVSPYYWEEQAWLEKEFGHLSYWTRNGVPRHLDRRANTVQDRLNRLSGSTNQESLGYNRDRFLPAPKPATPTRALSDRGTLRDRLGIDTLREAEQKRKERLAERLRRRRR